MSTETLTFETQLQQLEALVARLERGELPLDDALTAFEQGTKLVAACKQQLALAELKVEKIVAQAQSGDVTTEPFAQA